MREGACGAHAQARMRSNRVQHASGASEQRVREGRMQSTEAFHNFGKRSGALRKNAGVFRVALARVRASA
eukprot:11491107-Alexandrium_andersonii.AAC.1